MLGLLTKMKSWAYMILAAVAVIAGAYAVGARQARKSMQLDQAKRELDTQRKINAADEKIIKMDNDDIRSELAKFVRKR